jgi:hypothetical protein
MSSSFEFFLCLCPLRRVKGSCENVPMTDLLVNIFTNQHQREIDAVERGASRREELQGEELQGEKSSMERRATRGKEFHETRRPQ